MYSWDLSEIAVEPLAGAPDVLRTTVAALAAAEMGDDPGLLVVGTRISSSGVTCASPPMTGEHALTGVDRASVARIEAAVAEARAADEARAHARRAGRRRSCCCCRWFGGSGRAEVAPADVDMKEPLVQQVSGLTEQLGDFSERTARDSAVVISRASMTTGTF